MRAAARRRPPAYTRRSFAFARPPFPPAPRPLLTLPAPSAPAARPAVVGVLKGFDQLVNIVLDDTTEYLPTPAGGAGATRYLGLVVCRGPAITVVGPEDGMEEIANPFLGGDDEAGEEGAAQ